MCGEPSLDGDLQAPAPAPRQYVAMNCDCASSRHLVQFVFDPEFGNLYLNFQLARWPGFFRRCWLALKYIFNYVDGSDKVNTYWDTVILNQHTAEIEELCRKARLAYKEKAWAS